MFAIQYYDCFDVTPAGYARKDGQPKGKFATKEEASNHADMQIEKYGADDAVTYKIVEVQS